MENAGIIIIGNEILSGRTKDLNVSLMSGHQGQYVIMIPEKDLIVTRLGERDIDLPGVGVSGDVLLYIDEALKLIED